MATLHCGGVLSFLWGEEASILHWLHCMDSTAWRQGLFPREQRGTGMPELCFGIVHLGVKAGMTTSHTLMRQGRLARACSD